MPTRTRCYARHDFPVVALTDHDARVESFIILKMMNRREELLMPRAEQHPSATAQVIQPFLFIFYLETERRRIDAIRSIKTSDEPRG